MTLAPDDDALRAQLEALHQESWAWALACCTGDRSQAEEALHVTYQKLLQGRARYEGRSAFKTWLFGVIRLTALDLRRWNWRRWLRWAPAEEAHRQFAPEPDATAAMQAEERREEVRQALNQLSSRQAEALRLVFYHDLSLDETAAVMGVSPGSARTHYERGKQRLRLLLTNTPASR